ncbi:MAG: hypothetical protein DMG48_12970 [Acidobacteria bacterium]|nr:MAG: hypothetical protein DMG48_12970 [Acidobacteriota bacterium]
MEDGKAKLETPKLEIGKKKIPRFDADFAPTLLLNKGQGQARAGPPARAHAQNQRARHSSYGLDA